MADCYGTLVKRIIREGSGLLRARSLHDLLCQGSSSDCYILLHISIWLYLSKSTKYYSEHALWRQATSLLVFLHISVLFCFCMVFTRSFISLHQSPHETSIWIIFKECLTFNFWYKDHNFWLESRMVGVVWVNGIQRQNLMRWKTSIKASKIVQRPQFSVGVWRVCW